MSKFISEIERNSALVEIRIGILKHFQRAYTPMYAKINMVISP